MMMRVATFAISDQMIAAAQRTQSVMANDQLEQASGVTSTDYGGLGETSFIQDVRWASVFFRPRGHRRSTRTRIPSLGLAGS